MHPTSASDAPTRTHASTAAGWRRMWPVYAVLVVMVALTFAAARSAALVNRAQNQARFERAADRMQEHFQRAINRNLIVFDGLRGLANANVSLNRQQFHAYVDALNLREKYPGVEGLGFVWRTNPARQAADLQKLAERGLPDFRIWPKSDSAELYPIIFLAPAGGENDRWVGYDLHENAMMRWALEHAMEKGEPFATPPNVAVNEFFLTVPLYRGGTVPETPELRRERHFGYFFCRLRPAELFNTFANWQKDAAIHVRVSDGIDSPRKDPDSAGESPPPAFSTLRSLTVADRTWTVYFGSRPEFIKGSIRPLNPFLAGSGALISLLLFGIMMARSKARVAAEHAQDELERQRAELQLIFDAVPAVIFYKDREHRLVRINAEAERLAGVPRESLEGRTDEELGRAHADQYCRDEDEVMSSGEPKRGILEPLETTSGTRWLQTDKLPHRDRAGRIIGVIGFALDVTERRAADARVRAQLARLELMNQITRAIGERLDLPSIFQVVVRTVEEQLPLDFCCLALHDEHAPALTVAHVAARDPALLPGLAMTEHSRIEIEGLSRCVHGDLVYEPDLAPLQFPFAQQLARGALRALVAAPLLVEGKVFGVLFAARREPESFTSGECEFLRQLSEHVALAAQQTQLHSALQEAYEDLRQTQQAIMQQERLRALGQMASGVAHDINNAISPVTLYTEALLKNEPLSIRGRQFLETIQQAIEDVAETVSRMREFYREREPDLSFAAVDLNRLAEQVINLTRARWHDIPLQHGCVIDVATVFADALPPIMGVESEIRDALTNLILNAVDAVPEGGRLEVRTRVAIPAESAPWPHRSQVCIEVADSGLGMDEATRAHCLDPFYTTKGERGTGLGLAMVYGMVQRHGSTIEIDSALGRGTTVRLLFPVATDAQSPAAPDEMPQSAPHLRLLIVDDDPLIIEALRRTLEDDGHLVVAADGGQAGIDAFTAARARAESFQLVITDLGMPHVDGRKVAAEIKALAPETPVILLTGWGRRLVAEGEVPAHIDRILAKPPKLRELRETLAHYFPASNGK